MKIKEMKHLFPDDVRTLCIEHNWYTNGTSDEFCQMLDSIRKRKNITANFIYTIACDIFVHSNLKDWGENIDDVLENLMCYIINDCVRTSVTIER